MSRSPEQDARRSRASRIELEGNEPGTGRLARVERALTRALAGTGVELVHARRTGDAQGDREGSEKTGIVVRHRWPPNHTPIGDAVFLVQWLPWALGAIPEAWREPLFRYAHEVWVDTTAARDALVTAGFNEERVVVARVGVDTRTFTPDAPPATLPTGKRFRFLFVGSTGEEEGLDLVQAAYSAEFTGDDDVALVVVRESLPVAGEGRRSEFPVPASDGDAPALLVLDDAIKPGVYTACDALLHPARIESAALSVLEAMAAGLPVVATRAVGPFELDETHGFPIDARPVPMPDGVRARLQVTGPAPWSEPDLTALRRVMRALYEGKEQTRERVERARRWMEEEWTWERAAKQAATRLDALLAERGRTLQALAHFMDGSQALEAGNPSEACRALEAALSIEPCFPFALSEYAVALAQTGRLDGARQALEQAMALAPDLEEVQKNLALVRSLLDEKGTGTEGP